MRGFLRFCFCTPVPKTTSESDPEELQDLDNQPSLLSPIEDNVFEASTPREGVLNRGFSVEDFALGRASPVAENHIESQSSPEDNQDKFWWDCSGDTSTIAYIEEPQQARMLDDPPDGDPPNGRTFTTEYNVHLGTRRSNPGGHAMLGNNDRDIRAQNSQGFPQDATQNRGSINQQES